MSVNNFGTESIKMSLEHAPIADKSPKMLVYFLLLLPTLCKAG